MTQPAHISHTPARQVPISNTCEGELTPSNYSKQPLSPELNVNELLPKNRKFELLSAYMDNEVSEEERKEVEGWLASDPEVQKQHRYQLRLSQAMKSLLK